MISVQVVYTRESGEVVELKGVIEGVSKTHLGVLMCCDRGYSQGLRKLTVLISQERDRWDI